MKIIVLRDFRMLLRMLGMRAMLSLHVHKEKGCSQTALFYEF